MLTMRRIQGAACRIRCGGSSLTARLAIGGDDYGDVDPGVLDSALPARAVLNRLWDEPRCRAQLVPMWRNACEEVGRAPPSRRWQQV